MCSQRLSLLHLNDHLPRSSLFPTLSGFVSEKSLSKADTIAALKNIYPESADGVAMKTYFDDRGHIIDELFGGRVSLQVRQPKQSQNTGIYFTMSCYRG